MLGLPWWFSGKESACNAGDADSIPGSGRSSGEGNGNPLQYSCLGNPMDRGTGRLQSMGVTKKLDTTKWLKNNNIISALDYCRGRPGAKIMEQEHMNTKGSDDKVQKRWVIAEKTNVVVKSSNKTICIRSPLCPINCSPEGPTYYQYYPLILSPFFLIPFDAESSNM